MGSRAEPADDTVGRWERFPAEIPAGRLESCMRGRQAVGRVGPSLITRRTGTIQWRTGWLSWGAVERTSGNFRRITPGDNRSIVTVCFQTRGRSVGLGSYVKFGKENDEQWAQFVVLFMRVTWVTDDATPRNFKLNPVKQLSYSSN